MSGHGRISLIIPVFNAARFLPEAIDSVRKQSRKVDEIIVVDDASTDDTARVAKTLGPDIILVSCDNNGGPAVARNKGIERASGAIIAFLDADDIWPHDSVEVRLQALETDKSLAIVSGQIEAIGTSLPARPKNFAGDFVGYAMHFGCALIRREAFEKVGMLNSSLRTGEDSDWFMRAREKGIGIKVLNQVVMIYRRHSANMTSDYDEAMMDGLRMLKRSLDRRRATGGTALPLKKWADPEG